MERGQKRVFCVGEVAVYPGHGVGRIEAIEERELSGSKKNFYILRILDSDMTIMVPVDGVENSGLRPICGIEEVKKVYEILKEKTFVRDNSPWNRRYKEYMEKIRSGSIFDVASVLKELYSLKLWKELSFGEKKMFEMAKNLLKKELSFALKKEEDVIEAEIESIIKKSSKD